MARLRKYGTKSLVDLSLEGLERNAFAVYADVPVFLIPGNDTVSKDFAVPDSRHFEEFAAFDGEHHLHGVEAADISIDAHEIHEAVVG